ncbi:MAG: hypothetical protein ABL914_11165 [Novosphingobium sp.]|uniref:hypothetical protein n=1 Tax=Novosphingobium sp. TaxID=1874826 RepID=UPI0032BE08E2
MASKLRIRPILVTVWIIMVVIASALLAQFSATKGTLILTAAPLALVPILGLHFLRDNEARAGWVAVTLWLGLTYAGSGEPVELAVCAAIFAIGLAGYFRSAWSFPIAWFGHIAWDFAPRTLPAILADLPTACIIFDGIIGLYLIAMARKRWAS